MEIEKVAELLVYVVLTMLAADKAWAIFGKKPKNGGTNGKLSHIQEELDEMRRAKIEQKLEEMLAWVKDNHEDIQTLREENAKSHREIVEKVRNLFEGAK